MWALHEVRWWEFVIRATVVFLSVVVLLRIAGKRQVGQMGTGQLVALLLISNAVQNAMNGNDGSITGGLILAATVMAWSFLFEFLTSRNKTFETLVQGRPTLLIHRGKVVRDALHAEMLSVTELRAILRKQGIHEFGEVEQAILESDGYISVQKKGEKPDTAYASEAEESG